MTAAEPMQPWLLNPDPDWPGQPLKPEGEGWIYVRNEVDAAQRFPDYPTLEIVADAAGYYPAIHETLALYGLNLTLLFGIGGWTGPGCGSVLALGRRGGAWVRRVDDPAWTHEGDMLEADDG